MLQLRGSNFPLGPLRKLYCLNSLKSPFLSHLCLQELNSRQVLLSLSVICHITRGSHSKEIPHPYHILLMAEILTSHSFCQDSCGEVTIDKICLPQMAVAKFLVPWSEGAQILLGNMLSNFGCQWAQQNDGETQRLKSCPQMCTQSILEVDPTWRSEPRPSL